MANIAVYVRVRPILSHQQQRNSITRKIFYEQDLKQVRVDVSDKRQKIFKFNKLFTEKYQQQDIFLQIDMPILIERVLDGYHSTLFAYGQTGSGKTFTIEGQQNHKQGLIPRSIKNLFELLSRKDHNQRHYKVFLSYLQIYNQNIFDLIDHQQNKPLKMRWNKHQQFIVQQLFQGQCRDYQQAIRWWKKGQKHKIMGSHKMNSTSSRSHCILTLKVISYELQDPSNILQSKLEIIDLAGSQRYKVTKSTGVVFKQGIQINKSLFTLRQVINALYQASIGQKQHRHIPYRQSKLTSLLKQSIGGNTFCTMIACLNPTQNHFQQSLQTLTYASMASYISNVPVKNIDPKIRQNQILKDQNKQLKQQINKLYEHVNYLTKLLENSICSKCSNKKQQKKQQRSQSSLYQSKQPLGIVKLPKFSQTPKHLISQSRQNNTDQVIIQQNQINLTKTDSKLNDKNRYLIKNNNNNVKTSKQVLQSINMIKQLISANTGLRQKIQILQAQQEKSQKQIYSLIKENQVLRDRWNIINQAIVQQQQVNTPIVAYQRLLQQQKGRGLRLASQHSHKKTYNDFLQQRQTRDRRKRQVFHSKRKKKQYSNYSNKYDSFAL